MRIWPGGNCTPLAKKELKWFGPFGLITYLCGITFIDRLNPERAKKVIDNLAVRINKENVRLCFNLTKHT
jgi:lysophosphatidate acyltransferase